jgi:hypothetical protein
VLRAETRLKSSPWRVNFLFDKATMSPSNVGWAPFSVGFEMAVGFVATLSMPRRQSARCSCADEGVR